MKKFILCVCCVFLSGAAAQALAFKNISTANAEVSVDLYTGQTVAAGDRVTKLDPKLMVLSKAVWSIHSANPNDPIISVPCDLKGKHPLLGDNQTVLLEFSKGNYSCKLSP